LTDNVYRDYVLCCVQKSVLLHAVLAWTEIMYWTAVCYGNCCGTYSRIPHSDNTCRNSWSHLLL